MKKIGIALRFKNDFDDMKFRDWQTFVIGRFCKLPIDYDLFTKFKESFHI